MAYTRQNALLYLYYALLLFVLASWTSETVAPSTPMRIMYMVALFIPALFKKEWIPAVFTCFPAVAIYGFAYTYLPYDNYIYAALALVCLGAVLFTSKSQVKAVPPIFWLFVFYITIVNIATSYSVSDATYALIVMIVVMMALNLEEDETFHKWSMAFSAASLALSLLFLIYGKEFTTLYSYQDNIERQGWTDPNYFGVVLGMGVMSSILLLRDIKRLRIIETVMLITTIVCALPSMLLSASRGAILALAVGVMVVLIFSNFHKGWKSILSMAAVIFIVYLYQNNYFDLLMYRMDNMQGGTLTNGRTAIWASKLDSFLSDGNILNVLFGYGYEGGIALGEHSIGFHNDIIAHFVDFGIVGFIIFIVFLMFPIRYAKGKIKEHIPFWSTYLFFITALLSLEPLSSGRIVYYLFFAYVLFIAKLRVQ